MVVAALPPFLTTWAVNLAITFAVRQLGKFRDSIDWTVVQHDAAKRVRDVLPGTWFDNEGAELVVAVIEGVRVVCNQTAAIEQIMKMTANGDFEGAITALKKLVLGVWVPTSEAGKKTFALLEADYKAAYPDAVVGAAVA